MTVNKNSRGKNALRALVAIIGVGAVLVVYSRFTTREESLPKAIPPRAASEVNAGAGLPVITGEKTEPDSTENRSLEPISPAIDESAAASVDSPGSDRRMELATALRSLFSRSTSDSPPPFVEVERIVTELAGEMAIDPETVVRDGSGNVQSAVLTMPDTDIVANLSLSESGAYLSFGLPPTPNEGLYAAGAMNLRVDMDGNSALSGMTGFQHYADTRKASGSFMAKGQSKICGWTYAAKNGQPIVTAIEMMPAKDGVGWIIGKVGKMKPVTLSGGINLGPYHAWAQTLTTGIGEL